MYRIRGADQQEYGPVTAGVLRQWIAEGRATAESRVQKEGTSEWHPLPQFPEFQAALAAVQAGAAISRPGGGQGAAAAAGAKPSKTLSITSLVLGVLGLVPFGLITGLPAIITGHIAHQRARKAPTRFGGRGMAMAGFILGYLSILTTIAWVAASRVPMAIQRQRMQGAFYASCQGNLRQLWMAAQVYANGHRDELPPDYISMKGDLSPKTLVCPNDNSKTAATNWAEVGPENISYEFLSPNLKLDDKRTNAVIFRCPIHGTAIYGNGRFRFRRGNGPHPAPLTNSAPAE